MSKKVFIDFEFNHSERRLINVVCVSLKVGRGGVSHTHWLHNNPAGIHAAATEIDELGRGGAVFFAFLASAECRGMQALGLDPMDYKWVDIFAEWRQLKYNNYKRMYGRYLRAKPVSCATGTLEYGKHGYSVPPSLVKADNVGKDNTEVGNSYVAVTYHLLGKKLDSRHKDQMRDLILSDPDEFTAEEQGDISRYCESDIEHLPELIGVISKEIRHNFRLTPEQYRDISLERGRYSGPVIAAIEQNGMPFRVEAADHLTMNVGAARDALIEAYSKRVERPFYRRQKRTLKDFKGVWVEKYTEFERYIQSKPEYANWPLTKKSKEADAKTIRLSRDDSDLKMYRGDPTIDEYRNVRKALKGLESFDPNSKSARDNGMVQDSVDRTDNRLRILFGVFGTMTGRNAPKARRFPFAMGAWARSLLMAEEGSSICMVDYSSQEFLVAAILSQDPNMIAAYDSGDPYLYFAQAAGAVPWTGTKETHPKERDLFKATTLGLQFGMGSENLARKLTVDCGRYVSEKEARDLIGLHRKIYRTYWKWTEKVLRTYKRDGYLLLADGWGLNGNCQRDLSVRNMPVQGTAAVILRRATIRAIEMGVPLIAPLHDAEYFAENDTDYEDQQGKLVEAMDWAVTMTLGEAAKMRKDIVRHTHGEVWVEKRAAAVYESLAPFMVPHTTPNKERREKIKEILGT